jgi:hypothetical protein
VRATRFHPSLIWIGILLLLLPLLLGTRAQPVADSAAPVPSTPAAPAEPSVPLIKDVAPSGPAAVRTAAGDDQRCVEALYQLELLVGKYKVFKPGPGDSRTYLDDRDRPAEIDRLGRVRDETCSDAQPAQGSQKRRAAELFHALSAGCREAREKIRLLERPESRTSRNELARQREQLLRSCPEVPDAEAPADVWLADRVWQWHAR